MEGKRRARRIGVILASERKEAQEVLAASLFICYGWPCACDLDTCFRFWGPANPILGHWSQFGWSEPVAWDGKSSAKKRLSVLRLEMRFIGHQVIYLLLLTITLCRLDWSKCHADPGTPRKISRSAAIKHIWFPAVLGSMQVGKTWSVCSYRVARPIYNSHHAFFPVGCLAHGIAEKPLGETEIRNHYIIVFNSVANRISWACMQMCDITLSIPVITLEPE